VAQHQRTDRLLLGGGGLLGVDHHGKRRRDALVAASRVAHHGDHRPGHAGVARRGGVGQYPRENAVAHNLPFALATERTPYAVAELPGESLLGGGLVQAACFEDEAQFVEGRRRGELPHAVQREGYFAPILFGRRGRTFVERHLAVALEVYERGMAARDHRRGTVPGAPGLDLDIEFLGDTLLQVDTYALFVDIPAALRNGFGRHIAQHFQPVLRTADERPERHGDRQADHPRTGDPNAHGVFEDIGAQAHGDLFGTRAEQFGGTRRAQRHGDGFGTPDGGHHFAVDEGDNTLSFVLGQHGCFFSDVTKITIFRYFCIRQVRRRHGKSEKTQLESSHQRIPRPQTLVYGTPREHRTARWAPHTRLLRLRISRLGERHRHYERGEIRLYRPVPPRAGRNGL